MRCIKVWSLQSYYDKKIIITWHNLKLLIEFFGLFFRSTVKFYPKPDSEGLNMFFPNIYFMKILHYSSSSADKIVQDKQFFLETDQRLLKNIQRVSFDIFLHIFFQIHICFKRHRFVCLEGRDWMWLWYWCFSIFSEVIEIFQSEIVFFLQTQAHWIEFIFYLECIHSSFVFVFE